MHDEISKAIIEKRWIFPSIFCDFFLQQIAHAQYTMVPRTAAAAVARDPGCSNVQHNKSSSHLTSNTVFSQGFPFLLHICHHLDKCTNFSTPTSFRAFPLRWVTVGTPQKWTVGSPDGSRGYPNGLVLLLFDPRGNLRAHQHEVCAGLQQGKHGSITFY